MRGWTTHYHTMYLPFVIFVASIGYLNVVNYISTLRRGNIIYLIVVIYAILMVGFFNPYTRRFENDFPAPFKHGIVSKVFRYYFDPIGSYERLAPILAREIEEIIPKGVKVSCIEGVMTTLYKDREVSIYPVNLGSVDYVVIGGTAVNNQITSVSGAQGNLSVIQLEALNKCLLQRLVVEKFVLYKDIPLFNVLVFKRI